MTITNNHPGIGTRKGDGQLVVMTSSPLFISLDRSPKSTTKES